MYGPVILKLGFCSGDKVHLWVGFNMLYITGTWHSKIYCLQYILDSQTGIEMVIVWQNVQKTIPLVLLTVITHY